MFFRKVREYPEIGLCIAVPHVERPQNYLLQTVRSLAGSGTLENTTIAVCDFSAAPSRNLQSVVEEFGPLIASGHLIADRFTGDAPRLEGLARNFGDSEERVKWRSKQVLDAAYMMQRYSRLTPFYLHLEDDMVLASPGSLSAVRRILATAPATWFSVKLSPLGACAIAFPSADLPQMAAFLRLMYSEMPLDWLIDAHIEFKKKTGRTSSVRKGLFEHIGVHSTLAGQIR